MVDHSTVLYVNEILSNYNLNILTDTCDIDNSTNMGINYLKTCDSQYNALALIKKEMKYHGSDPTTLEAPICDPDGSYYSKQCDGSQCFCKTRANEEIGGYFTERGTESERTQKCCISISWFNDQRFLILSFLF